MIKLFGQVPRKFTLAVSGGPDSMAALDFFRRGKKDITVAHYDHGTTFGAQAKEVVREYCAIYSIPLLESSIDEDLEGNCQAFWRRNRYNFFEEVLDQVPGPIITAHTLDDAVEWWIFTALRGAPKLLPYQNGIYGVIRPFILTPRSEMLAWAHNHKVSYLKDPGNTDRKYSRSIIRHDILPSAEKINPGIRTTIAKLLTQRGTDLMV